MVNKPVGQEMLVGRYSGPILEPQRARLTQALRVNERFQKHDSVLVLEMRLLSEDKQLRVTMT